MIEKSFASFLYAQTSNLYKPKNACFVSKIFKKLAKITNASKQEKKKRKKKDK